MIKRQRKIPNSAVLSTKNQIVIPEPVRSIEKFLPGDEVAFIQNNYGEVVIKNNSVLEVSTLSNDEEIYHEKLNEIFNQDNPKVIVAVLDFSIEERAIKSLRKYIELSELNIEAITSNYEENEQQFLVQSNKLKNSIVRNQQKNELPEVYLLPYYLITNKTWKFSNDVITKLKDEVLGKAPLLITLSSNELTSTNKSVEDFIKDSFEGNYMKLEDFIILDFNEMSISEVIEGKLIK